MLNRSTYLAVLLVAALNRCSSGPLAHEPAASPAEAPITQSRTVGWTAYGADPGGSRYSPDRQIDRTNVTTLREAWTFRTGALDSATKLNEKAAFEATPIVFEGRLYFTSPFNEVFAVDGANGELFWRFDPKLDRSQSRSEVTSRGVSLWVEPGSQATCGARIILGTLDARLIALDARSGSPCLEFGSGGSIDLSKDVGLKDRGDYQITSPAAIVGDLIIVGSSIGDNGRFDRERGTVRAFDARSGALRWSWDPLGPEVGQTGAANAWAVISADPSRDLVFIPTGSASPDYFGGRRPGANEHANSVVALRASTGETVWSFQVVHHDLWDYDVAAQPILVQVPRDGRLIDAVAIGTKMGNVFILHRETGEPLFPVEERSVPSSDVPGEEAWPTQPFPENPPLVPHGLTAADAWGVTEDERQACARSIAQLRSEGIFTPPSLEGTVVFPGNVGGIAWGGMSWDPERGLLITNTNRLAIMVRLVERREFDEELSGSGRRLSGEYGSQRGTPYGMYREPLLSPGGMPCNQPPWGTLTAVDLATGLKRWEVPLGKMRTGTEEIHGLLNLGGSVVTRGGLTFIAATRGEDVLRAFDTETGQLLWQSALPAGGQATPMAYTIDGRQFIVIAAGGHGKLGTKQGDSLIAFALPD